jgi:hypothetical protein
MHKNYLKLAITANTQQTGLLALLLLFNLLFHANALYYDGLQSYSIYPRLDLQLCSNSTLSFDFTVSTSSHFNEYFDSSLNIGGGNSLNIKNTQNGRLLLYSEQQVQVNSLGTNSKKLINSYFLVKLVNGNRLVLNDYWTVNDISFELPSDYATSWFRLVYTRRSTTAEINLYKFETAKSSQNEITSVKLILIFSKQVIHTNFIAEEINLKTSSASSSASYDLVITIFLKEFNFKRRQILKFEF